MKNKNCQKFVDESKSLNSVEAINLLASLSKDWSINIENKLFAAYKFKDYDEALEYVLKISKFLPNKITILTSALAGAM